MSISLLDDPPQLAPVESHDSSCPPTRDPGSPFAGRRRFSADERNYGPAHQGASQETGHQPAGNRKIPDPEPARRDDAGGNPRARSPGARLGSGVAGFQPGEVSD